MEMIGVASLLRVMPAGYEEACFSTGAIIRKRDIKDPNDLMMLALFHLLTGCSLIEVSEISKLAKLGDISDVAFMKRFSNCNEWFKWILTAIQDTTHGIIHYNVPERLSRYRIMAVDASDVTEKGTSGRIFRLHFALDIGNMQAALYKITSNSTGKHLRNFELADGDLVIADRIYSSVTGIEYCLSKGCHYIARMRANSFKPYSAEGIQLDLLSIALDSTRKKMKRKESKKQMSFSTSTYTFNEYLVVCTSLDKTITAEEIIELYRYRWQVELYFKRLKSILGYGELPKKSEKSIYSWLNGKLMIALLIESVIGNAVFSPFDYEYEEYLEGDENGEASFAE